MIAFHVCFPGQSSGWWPMSAFHVCFPVQSLGWWPMSAFHVCFPGQSSGWWPMSAFHVCFPGQLLVEAEDDQENLCQDKRKSRKEFVSKWLKWKLGRRPGHRSIWTVFVFWRIRLVSIFPSLVEISRIQTVWVSKITTESWIMRKRWSWTRSSRTRVKGREEEEDPRQ